MEAAELPKTCFGSETTNGVVGDNQFTDIFGAVPAEKGADLILSVDALDGVPQLQETESTQNRERYNLRKSLAWDSAFFTSAGVLDPEELSIMIIRADKSPTLCGIQEEVALSTESFSTFGSDTPTLEALEDDLFVDVRASIQRSNWEPSNLKTPSSNKNPKDAHCPNNSGNISLTAVDESLASQNKIQKPVVKRGVGIPSGRMLKSQPSQNVGKLVNGKQLKQGAINLSVAQIKPGVRSLEKNPPIVSKLSSKGISSSAKRESTGNAHAKSECGSPKHVAPSGKPTLLQPKGSIMSGVRRVLPKPVVVSSSTSKPSFVSSSTSKSLQSLPESCPKAPSRPPGIKNKQPSNAVATAVKNSVSSAPSPASSISEWSSTSSCSTSMANALRSDISRASIDAVSLKSVEGNVVSDRMSRSGGRSGDRLKNQEGSNKKTLPPHQSAQVSGKPSGLRMPSPKIGFFDGVRASTCTPNRNQQSQSRLRKLTPKSAASPGGSSSSKSNMKKNSHATAVMSSSSCLSPGESSEKVMAENMEEKPSFVDCHQSDLFLQNNHHVLHSEEGDETAVDRSSASEDSRKSNKDEWKEESPKNDTIENNSKGPSKSSSPCASSSLSPDSRTPFAPMNNSDEMAARSAQALL
ncbi:hypothetical protein M569_02118 [Genlisea aurea]|uniref:Uncharacterized protein n=1 Tax=Genlisea aurea TaxID=192259 RepID=S8D5D0_9LAMI|nr:hypothetical protein M569_02118 [Genlisea aurea]